MGAAQYRTGQYEQSLATLTRSKQLDGDREPTALAFLAMTQHRLNQVDAARATLERLRELMKDPDIGVDDEDRASLREAEALILNLPGLPEDVFAP